MVLEFWG